MKRKKLLYSSLALLAGLCLAGFALGIARAAATDAAAVDLAVTLKAPSHVAAGQLYALNLAYANIGTTAAPADTWVSITLPAGVTFQEATGQDGLPLPPDQVTGSVLLWQVGALPADSCWSHIWITVLVAPDAAEGDILNASAEIGSSALDADPVNNLASAASEVCDMAGSTKQAQAGQVKPGGVVTYTITLLKAPGSGGTAADQRTVTLVDTLPPAEQATFLGWVGPLTGQYNGQTLQWQGSLQAGQPLMLQYRLGIPGSVPSGTLVTNRAHLYWQGGEMALDAVDVSVTMDPNDHMLGPGGGEWQYAYGVSIQAPPNAVTQTTRFQFRPLFTQDPPPDVPPGWQFAHRAFELTAFQFGELQRLNRPITITLGYNPPDFAGLNHYNLRLWQRSSPGEPWAMLGEQYAYQYGKVIVETDLLGEFVLIGQSGNMLYLPRLNR